mmetsp:Transcript_12721/g.18052  ORF Transcript_12721/g.18052 Transcript_12721/m.18052 type:complete len:266 (-) Transcript_12721:76-873(-)
MTELNIREILCNNISYNLTPQLRHIQHIGLVNTTELSITFGSNVASNTGNTLNLVFGVNHVIVTNAFAINNVDTLGGTKVNITGKFTDNHNIDSLNNLSLKSGCINQLWKNLGRTQVCEESHFLPHLKQTSFGTKFTGIRIPLVSSDTSKKDRIRVPALFETFLREGIVLFINGTSSNECFLKFHFETATFAESSQDILGCRCDFRPDTISRKKSYTVRILFGNSVKSRCLSSKGRSRWSKCICSTEKEKGCCDRKFHFSIYNLQ